VQSFRVHEISGDSVVFTCSRRKCNCTTLQYITSKKKALFINGINFSSYISSKILSVTMLFDLKILSGTMLFDLKILSGTILFDLKISSGTMLFDLKILSGTTLFDLKILSGTMLFVLSFSN